MKRLFLKILCAAALLFLAPIPAAAGEFGPEPPPVEPVLTVDDIPLQIVHARVGDWASYTNTEGHTLRLTVVERWNEHNDDHLVIRSSLTKKKKRRTTHSEDQVSVKDRVADLRDLGPKDTLGRSEVLIGKRAVSCVVINYHDDGDELTRQSYLSDEVPVYGLVRGVLVEGNKRTIMLKLEDYGFADENGNE